MKPALLVADIGATHARFSWADEQSLVGEPVIVATAAFATSDALIDAAMDQLPSRVPAAATLAVAGPVHSGQGRITNGTLCFDARALSRRLSCEVTVVNDFHALARALPDLEYLLQLGGDAPQPGVKAVLGPGSGLGMGLLVPRDGRWQVLASEGGHADLAPGNPLEAEIVSVLQSIHGHASWETALSGPGLVRLHEAVCRVWGVDAEPVTSEQVTGRGVAADDPVCHQTLEIFFSLLGAAAGNLALTVCARGGVYLGGGILPALRDFAAGSPLRRRFDERGAMSEMVRAIPLYLILDVAPGLAGALACLHDRPGNPEHPTEA